MWLPGGVDLLDVPPLSLLPAGEGKGECGELVGSGGGVHDVLPEETHQGFHCGL